MPKIKTKTISPKPCFDKLLGEIDEAGKTGAKAGPEAAQKIIADIKAWHPSAVEKNVLSDRIARNRDGFAPAAAEQLDAFSKDQLGKLASPGKLAATVDLAHLIETAVKDIGDGVGRLFRGGRPPPKKVTLSWDPPTTNQDGTPITNLTGYKVYYGNSSGNYTQTLNINDAGAIGYTLQGLPSGTYFFAVTALEPGAESKFSNEASAVIP